MEIWALQLQLVCCPSFSQREKLLRWASENLPCTWSSPLKTLSGGIPDLWKDGSLLCTLINIAVPGACPNPPKHWKKSPLHAQALAYKYFGLVPVFTEKDFSAPFSPTQERKFLTYLQDLQQAIKKHTFQSTPSSFSSDYLTKGMGLQTGEQHRKTTFYVYSNTVNSECKNIFVYIRGPYGTQGTATIPAFYNLNSIPVLNYLNKQFRASNKIMFKKEARKSFLKSIALDFTSFVNLDKKVLTNDIPILVEMEHDRAKVTYIPNNYGIFEINLITNGEYLNGSPFTVNIIENNMGRPDTFESTEKLLNDLPGIKKKRIISRFIDCVNEKIALDIPKTTFREKPILKTIASVSMVSDNENSTKSTTSIENFSEPLPRAVIQYESQSQLGEAFSLSEPRGKLQKICEDSIDNEIDSNQDKSYNEDVPENKSCERIDTENTKKLTKNTKFTNPLITVSFENNEALCLNLEEVGESNEFELENDFKNNLSNIPISTPKLNSCTNLGSLKDKSRKVCGTSRTSSLYMTEADSNKSEESNVHSENLSSKYSDKYSTQQAVTDLRENENLRNIEKHLTNNQAFTIRSLEIQNQNRPTSVVSPFLKMNNSRSEEKVPLPPRQNCRNEDKYKPLNEFFKNELPENSEKKLSFIFDEKELSRPEEVCESGLKVNAESISFSDEYTDSLEYNISDKEELESDKFLSGIQQKIKSMNNAYVETLNSVLLNRLKLQSESTKLIKDFVNTSNKLKTLNSNPLNQIEAINKFSTSSHSSIITSPICPTHIVQEVVPKKMLSFGSLSLSEKRKFFSRQASMSLPSSKDSSISEEENEDVSKQLSDEKHSLRVLSVIDTLKNSTINRNLNRTTSRSVPNISQSTNIISPNTVDRLDNSRSAFLKTRDYWKKISLENCSMNVSSSQHVNDIPTKKLARDRGDSLKYLSEFHRSADDLSSTSKINLKNKRMQKYRSLNQEDFTSTNFVSIEERKKLLLQERYEKENLGSRFLKKGTWRQKQLDVDSKEEEETRPKEKAVTEAIPSTLSTSFNQKTQKSKGALKKNPTKFQTDDNHVKPTSQFKRAITFFKNLEKGSSSKDSLKEKKIKSPKIRRYSLDFDNHKKQKSNVGGSLRLPKTLEKFSLTKIYFDIIENRGGSFKGRPNRKALSETLASLNTKSDTRPEENDSVDNIQYNMFLSRVKPKKRKSLRSVFDIYF
ncbi:hypothetical protein HHI36_016772 [Cryptolaemus montrouzieri]|uniref:Uncharacterized protein n=1 Tax=Cryptolaemus montrouzieri TaxID=559131 RepID=A0ABD2NL53_9CUCU